ncbi:hypothetical protein OsI_22071 [Oryza sativa Indica Group]|uniref:Uncharacterized protein n=2 Tax=Oryza sativa TaxID=4530 RepID=A3B9E3_ORYSJ|nr:hypothetical protein OsI_22071 [Oryza sativa Indica Group]EAZ36182.1 hypothetical protein OsJ_20495 [Oryza sativa Japonica Group]
MGATQQNGGQTYEALLFTGTTKKASRAGSSTRDCPRTLSLRISPISNTVPNDILNGTRIRTTSPTRVEAGHIERHPNPNNLTNKG